MRGGDFFLLPQALFRGVALFVGVACGVACGTGYGVACGVACGVTCGVACGACLWDGLWAGALTLPVASLFWWRKASVWMRKPWIEGCFLKIFVEF